MQPRNKVYQILTILSPFYMFTEQGIPTKALIAVKGPLDEAGREYCRLYDRLVEAPLRRAAAQKAEQEAQAQKGAQKKDK